MTKPDEIKTPAFLEDLMEFRMTREGQLKEKKMDLYIECACAMISNEESNKDKMFSTLNRLCKDFDERFKE